MLRAMQASVSVTLATLRSGPVTQCKDAPRIGISLTLWACSSPVLSKKGGGNVSTRARQKRQKNRPAPPHTSENFSQTRLLFRCLEISQRFFTFTHKPCAPIYPSASHHSPRFWLRALTSSGRAEEKKRAARQRPGKKDHRPQRRQGRPTSDATTTATQWPRVCSVQRNTPSAISPLAKCIWSIVVRYDLTKGAGLTSTPAKEALEERSVPRAPRSWCSVRTRTHGLTVSETYNYEGQSSVVRSGDRARLARRRLATPRATLNFAVLAKRATRHRTRRSPAEDPQPAPPRCCLPHGKPMPPKGEFPPRTPGVLPKGGPPDRSPEKHARGPNPRNPSPRPFALCRFPSRPAETHRHRRRQARRQIRPPINPPARPFDFFNLDNKEASTEE
jgi:hypothetical protein